jgi:hypothetical protein
MSQLDSFDIAVALTIAWLTAQAMLGVYKIVRR